MSAAILYRFLRVLSLFSLRAQYRLAALLAIVLRIVPNQIARQARANIRLCFGDRGLGEQRRLYRQTLRHTCNAMIELGALWCWPVERVRERIREVDVSPVYRRGDKARILLLPHLGSWETLGIWLGGHCEAIMLYKRRKRKHRAMDEFVIARRARYGGELVPTTRQGLRRLMQGLRKGATLVILPDQKPGGGKARIESTFFGHSAPTTTLVHNLCSRIDCDVFLASVCRSDPAGEFELRVEELEHARLAGDESDSAQYMNDCIEKLVRTRPEQYQWGYRRFSNRVYAGARQG